MIPKIIHYCWFGDKEPNDELLSVSKSWKDNLPGYIFIRWNEANFKIIDHKYARIAYDNKRYDLVANYAKLWALYNFGGIAINYDVEVVKTFNDFLDLPYFLGFDASDKRLDEGVFGSAAGDSLVKEVLDYYDNLDETNYDIALPDVISNIISNKYIYIPETIDMFIESKKYVNIFPRYYFSPLFKSYDGKLLDDYSNEDTYTKRHYITA